jgi:hypothetical protein
LGEFYFLVKGKIMKISKKAALTVAAVSVMLTAGCASHNAETASTQTTTTHTRHHHHHSGTQEAVLLKNHASCKGVKDSTSTVSGS